MGQPIVDSVNTQLVVLSSLRKQAEQTSKTSTPFMASASAPDSRILLCLVPALTACKNELLYGTVSERNHFFFEVAFGYDISSQW